MEKWSSLKKLAYLDYKKVKAMLRLSSLNLRGELIKYFIDHES